jgi:hypothetical protein
MPMWLLAAATVMWVAIRWWRERTVTRDLAIVTALTGRLGRDLVSLLRLRLDCPDGCARVALAPHGPPHSLLSSFARADRSSGHVVSDATTAPLRGGPLRRPRRYGTVELPRDEEWRPGMGPLPGTFPGFGGHGHGGSGPGGLGPGGFGSGGSGPGAQAPSGAVGGPGGSGQFPYGPPRVVAARACRLTGPRHRGAPGLWLQAARTRRSRPRQCVP